MYAEYFGLKEIPFRITPDPRFLWYSEQHLEAKQKILYHLTQSAGPIYLLVTDVVMPGMGGRELMRELRKMDPRVKGLAVTGYAVSEDLREEGIVEVVEKPFDVDNLAEAVRRALAAH